MATDSSTGGYLLPVGAAIAEDSALDAIFQKMIVGMAGLPGSLVRPRWQPNPPKAPDVATNWCAIGVTDDMPDANAVVAHDGTGDGKDDLQRHEEFTVTASFYGPNARGNAKMVRDGLYIAQNREAIAANGIGFVSTGNITAAPELINQQWQRRYDIPIRFRRVVNRSYAVLNIQSATATVQAADAAVYQSQINVTQ